MAEKGIVYDTGLTRPDPGTADRKATNRRSIVWDLVRKEEAAVPVQTPGSASPASAAQTQDHMSAEHFDPQDEECEDLLLGSRNEDEV